MTTVIELTLPWIELISFDLKSSINIIFLLLVLLFLANFSCSHIKKLRKQRNYEYDKHRWSSDIVGLYENFKGEPYLSGLEETPPDFYETLTESLNTAGFLNVKTMTKHAMEIVDYLEKEGTLKEYNITKADAMTLAVYTYDNGPDNFESNPYRMINKALAERDKGSTQVLRGYILRLLTALRKLPKYSSEAADGSKLYRAVTNISENAKTVGKIHIWPAFTSTSTDEDSVVDFLDKIGDDRGEKYIFEIGGYFDKGYNIRKLSFHSGEDEVLLEPGIQFKVVDVKKDTRVNGATRVFVEVLNTKPVLEKVVDNFAKMCEKNAAKESMYSAQKGVPPPMYRGLIGEKKTWGNLWNDIDTAYKSMKYTNVKEALWKMVGSNTLRKLVVEGYKKSVVDGDYCYGAQMKKWRDMNDEECCSVYSITYQYGTDVVNIPSNILNKMIEGWNEKRKTFREEWVTYLLHVVAGLKKLPIWEPRASDSNDSNDDKRGKSMYILIKTEEAERLVEGEEYTFGGFVVGSLRPPNEESLREGECVMRINSAHKLELHEIGPMSVWNNNGYVMCVPGEQFAVKEKRIAGKGGAVVEVVVEGIKMNESELCMVNECANNFELRRPLPEGWTAEIDDESGQVFYQNDDTGETQWEKPFDEDPGFFTDFGSGSLPPNWVARVDPKTGWTYYANTATKTTQWEFP